MTKEITYIGTKQDAMEEIRVLTEVGREILPAISQARPSKLMELTNELIGIRRIQMKMVEEFLQRRND